MDLTASRLFCAVSTNADSCAAGLFWRLLKLHAWLQFVKNVDLSLLMSYLLYALAETQLRY